MRGRYSERHRPPEGARSRRPSRVHVHAFAHPREPEPWGLSRTHSMNLLMSGWAESASREPYPRRRSPLDSEACTLRWHGAHRATVRAVSRRLSSCLPFLLRLILLAWERGRRWWRVRRSFPTRLPHSSHPPSALGSKFFLSLDIIPRLYGPSTQGDPPPGRPAG